jgi:hypothetical protein
VDHKILIDLKCPYFNFQVLNNATFLDSPHLTAQSLIDGLTKNQQKIETSDIDEDNLDQYADNGAIVRAAVLGKNKILSVSASFRRVPCPCPPKMCPAPKNMFWPSKLS